MILFNDSYYNHKHIVEVKLVAWSLLEDKELECYIKLRIYGVQNDYENFLNLEYCLKRYNELLDEIKKAELGYDFFG